MPATRRWRSVFHLLNPVPDDAAPPEPFAVGTPGYWWDLIGLTGEKPRPTRLPMVDPGRYRIVKDVRAGGRATRVVAYLTILPARPPGE